MELEDAKDALLQVARERLKLYPGLAERFEFEVAVSPTVGQMGPLVRMSIGELRGPAAQRALLAIVDEWSQRHIPGVKPLAAVAPKKETPQQRRARRWRACVDAGLAMPTDTYSAYPRGYGAIAKREGITRQSFKEDLDAHREEKFAR
ncbi:MAG TPA: hypothetical protein PKM45_05555 [Giesbergeria sp.]|nr:hypothetical protein [Ottowia sp.]HNQ09870.1 hypothetical protein [Giesbergeria sp.]